jgi:hypothetical protein
MGGRPMSARVRRGGSKSVENVLRALKRTAGGSAAADTAADMAPRIQKAMLSQLRPHKRTGAAASKATATASGPKITLENVGYGRYINGYFFARRFPKDWVLRVKKRLAANVRAEIRRVR